MTFRSPIAIFILLALVVAGVLTLRYIREKEAFTPMSLNVGKAKIFFFLIDSAKVASFIPAMQMPPKETADAVLSYDPKSPLKFRVETKDPELKAHIEKVASSYVKNPDAVKGPDELGAQTNPNDPGTTVYGESISIDEGPDYYLYSIAGDIRWNYQNKENEFKGMSLASFADEVE